MKTVFSIIIFALLLMTTGAETFPQQLNPPAVAHIFSVKLTDEGNGFGFDKAIEIVFRSDGSAAFRGGKNSGIRKGIFRGAIDRREFTKLAKLINANKFFALEDRYEGNISDMGTKTITVTYAGGEKTVINWGGSNLKAFAVIRDAIREIEAKIKWQADLETKKT